MTLFVWRLLIVYQFQTIEGDIQDRTIMTTEATILKNWIIIIIIEHYDKYIKLGHYFSSTAHRTKLSVNLHLSQQGNLSLWERFTSICRMSMINPEIHKTYFKFTFKLWRKHASRGGGRKMMQFFEEWSDVDECHLTGQNDL